jgi:hypothetical protein
MIAVQRVEEVTQFLHRRGLLQVPDRLTAHLPIL